MALKTPILIFCRVKPSEDNSESENQKYVIKHQLEKDILFITNQLTSVVVNHKPDSYSFQFSKVFDEKCSQEFVYDTIAKPIVQSALKGFNGTIFAYGQTGSGKTYTMTGNKENYGVIPRALCEIFDTINQVKDEKFDVQMSYLEIYNEHSNDLLNREEKRKITLREGCDKVFEWHNLSLCPVESFSTAMDLLEFGDKNRIVGDTPMNVFSSRSHTILTIYLTARIEETLEIKKAKLNLVDLAGSERVHKTGEEGIVLEEARHINLSLHYLQQVIIALSDQSRTHVPYRNCSLTSALRDSLGGNCMTAMVANVAMDKSNVEETVSTCRFAQRVSLVRNEVSVNLDKDLTVENSLLREEVRLLEAKCAALKAKVQEITKTSVSGEQPKQEVVKLQPASVSINNQQLQTDIIYLIGWLQDEMKEKQYHGSAPRINDTSLSSISVLSTVSDHDEGFEHFAAEMKDKEGWFKVKDEKQKVSDALTNKIDAISFIHQEILDWWKQHEKSLVREMMCGRTLNLRNSESSTDLPDLVINPPPYDLAINNLLHTHSDMLKDIQLLKSRLRSSKRDLQRIKRKYLVEYNGWKKSEKSTIANFPKNADAFNSFENMHIQEQSPHLSFKHFEDNSNGDSIKHKYDGNSGKPSLNDLESLSCDDKELSSERSFSVYDSDLNTTFSEMNDSVLSTSTFISDTSRLTMEPRLVRSTPGFLTSDCTLQRRSRSRYTISAYEDVPSSRPLSVPNSVHLTGDPDIDQEIKAFYKNKCKI